MRSPGEIAFRARQEAANLLLLAVPPSLPPRVQDRRAAAVLPDVAERLRGTQFAREVVRLAEGILQHRFPLLGTEVATGAEIRWRRDYRHGIETGTEFFRRIPYLDFARAGDHKLIWELNRHQHLVLLAQASRFTGRSEFLEELRTQLESWWTANPYLRGINWASALEVAFRALSWSWVDHLAGAHLEAAFGRRLRHELYRHGRYLEYNLSVYFSPNTHLLGEALALYVLGRLFPEFPGAARWSRTGSRILREQIALQVREDGSYFEQSSYYHLYALDMFLLYAVLADPPPEFLERLRGMAEYLDALLGPPRTLPFLGDDDGGRLFHPFGPRERFARATLATCGVLFGRPEWIGDPVDLQEQAAWWFGEGALAARVAPARTRESRLFSQAGIAILSSGDLQVVVDAGPFGPWASGHSHSDTLHLVARRGAEELLIDPGTYTYIASPEWRNRFRGSAAHNTIRVDGQDQATPTGPFSWKDQPAVEILEWQTGEDRDGIDAICRARGFTHRRRVVLIKPELLVVLDEISGAEGVHEIQQFWHCGRPVTSLGPDSFRIGDHCCLALEPGGDCEVIEGGEFGWRSPGFGEKQEAPLVCAARKTALPVTLAAAVEFSGKPVRLRREADGLALLREEGGILLYIRNEELRVAVHGSHV